MIKVWLQYDANTSDTKSARSANSARYRISRIGLGLGLAFRHTVCTAQTFSMTLQILLFFFIEVTHAQETCTRNLYLCTWPKLCGLIVWLRLKVSGTRNFHQIELRSIQYMFLVQVSWACVITINGKLLSGALPYWQLDAKRPYLLPASKPCRPRSSKTEDRRRLSSAR